tara:strand:- start:203 stop:775 length:573 start_codon:yes stop_codon:yes gene_type:complete
MSLIPFGFWAASGGGAAGAFDLLETTTTSGSPSFITFSGLGSYSGYKHLQLRITARSDFGGGLNQLAFRINDVATSSYAQHSLEGDGTSVTSAAFASRSNMSAPDSIAGSGASANIFGAAVVDILDFSSTNKNTTIRGLVGTAATGDISEPNKIMLFSGMYNSTDAVTSIRCTVTDTWADNSRLSLYGVK